MSGLTEQQRVELADKREFVRGLILANFTSGRYGYRLDPAKAADDVLDFLAPLIARMIADERKRIVAALEERASRSSYRDPYEITEAYLNAAHIASEEPTRASP